MRKIEVFSYDNGIHPFGVEILEEGDWLYDTALPISEETVEKLQKYDGAVTGFLSGCGWDHPPTRADEFIDLVIGKIPARMKVTEDGPNGYTRVLLHDRADRKMADEARQKYGYVNIQWRADADGTFGCLWRWIPDHSQQLEEYETEGSTENQAERIRFEPGSVSESIWLAIQNAFIDVEAKTGLRVSSLISQWCDCRFCGRSFWWGEFEKPGFGPYAKDWACKECACDLRETFSQAWRDTVTPEGEVPSLLFSQLINVPHREIISYAKAYGGVRFVGESIRYYIKKEDAESIEKLFLSERSV